MVKKGALKTYFAGVMISEGRTMNYDSRQTEWWGEMGRLLLVGRKSVL
jgi:hypothetical protein